jgi:hypothetical protein
VLTYTPDHRASSVFESEFGDQVYTCACVHRRWIFRSTIGFAVPLDSNYTVLTFRLSYWATAARGVVADIWMEASRAVRPPCPSHEPLGRRDGRGHHILDAGPVARDGRHGQREEVRAGRPASDGALHLHAFKSSKPRFQAGSRTMSGGSANCRGGTADARLAGAWVDFILHESFKAPYSIRAGRS